MSKQNMPKEEEGKYDDADEEGYYRIGDEVIIKAFIGCVVVDDAEEDDDDVVIEPNVEKPSCSTDPVKPKQVRVRVDRREYFRQYALEHKDQISVAKAKLYETKNKEKMAERYIENADAIKQFRLDHKFRCECCDITIGINSKSVHLKTAKHKKNAEKK